MVKKFKTFDPQLVFAEQTAGSAVVLTNEAKLSLYKKSQKSGYSTDILETVYYRGYSIWNESFGQTAEQFAFDRVNSFIAGGFAADLDDDLVENAKGYKNPTGGLTQKGRDMTAGINEGEVIKTKFAVKNMQKRGIEGPHPVVDDDLMRNWALHKMPKKTHDMPDISYHRGTARFHDMKKGTHFDVKGGSPRTTVMNTHPKPGDTKDPIGSIAPKTPVSFKQDKVKKKKGNVVPVKETIYEGIKTTGREDLHGKNSLEHHKQLKRSGYVSKGSERNSSGTEHSYYHPKSNTMHIFRAKGGKINHAFEYTPNISYGKAHGAVVHEENIVEKRGLWDNIHAKRERIKHGSGEHMRKPGSEGAPTAAALKASQNEAFSDNYMKQGREYLKLKRAKEKAAKNPQPKITSSDTDDMVKQFLAKGGSIKKMEEAKKIHTGKHFKNAETSEKQSHNPNDPDSRFDGTTAARNTYTKETPGQVVKRVIKEIAIRNIKGEMINIKNQKFRGSDNKIHSAPPGKSSSSGGGGGSDES